jgi:hypothetical protein
MIIDSLVIALGLDSKGISSGISKAQSEISSGVSRISGAVKGLVAPLLGAVAVGKTFMSYMTDADQIGDFAASVAESVEDIDGWGQAVQHAGGTMQSFQGTVSSLTKSLTQIATQGSGKAKKAFDELGISATDSQGRTKKATDVLMELAAVGEGMDTTDFRGLLTQAGIDEGTIMLLQSGKDAVAEAVAAGKEIAFTQEDADIAGEFGDLWQDLQKTFMKFASILMRIVGPAVNWFLEKVTKVVKYFSEHENFVKPLAIGLGVLAAVIHAKAIPAFLKMGATLLANPLTWVIAGIVGLALVIEDLLVWVDGGESALDDFWTALFGSPEEAKQIFETLKYDFNLLLQRISETVEGGKALFQDLWEAVGAMIDVMVITPVKKILELIQQAKDFITGDDVGGLADQGAVKRMYGHTNAEAASETDRLRAENQAKYQRQVAMAQVDNIRQIAASMAPSPAMAAGPAEAAAATEVSQEVNNNNDNSTEVNVGSINVQTQATDPAGIGEATSAALGKNISRGTQRSSK